jgi:hypothetical protein
MSLYKTKRMFWASRDPMADQSEQYIKREVIKVDFAFDWRDVISIESHMNNIPALECEDKCYIGLFESQYLVNESFENIFKKWKEFKSNYVKYLNN